MGREKLKLGLIQTKQNRNYDFHDTEPPESVEEALDNQKAMIEQTTGLMEEAGRLGCNLIVTPEAVNFPGLKRFHGGNLPDMVPEESAPLWDRWGKLAEKYGSYVVAGAYNKRKDEGGGFRCFNSAFLYAPDGHKLDVYDKIHAGRDEGIEPGDKFCVLDTPFGVIGVCICWDMQFPETARTLALMGAELIVVPTWGWEHLYAQARAYENGIFVAAAMGIPYEKPISGVRSPSQVIGPNGAVLAEASRDQAQVLVCEINLEECKSFRQVRLGDRRPELYKR